MSFKSDNYKYLEGDIVYLLSEDEQLTYAELRHVKKLLDSFGLKHKLNFRNYAQASTFFRSGLLSNGNTFTSGPEDDLWSKEEGALTWAKKSFDDQKDSRTNTYKEMRILTNLLKDKNFVNEIVQDSDFVSLIDLGCGNGEKANTIIKSLNNTVLCYYPVDKSMFMNAIALTNIRDLENEVLGSCCVASAFYEFAQRSRSYANSSLDSLIGSAEKVRGIFHNVKNIMDFLISDSRYDPASGTCVNNLITEISSQKNIIESRLDEISYIIQEKNETKLRYLSAVSNTFHIFINSGPMKDIYAGADVNYVLNSKLKLEDVYGPSSYFMSENDKYLISVINNLERFFNFFSRSRIFDLFSPRSQVLPGSFYTPLQNYPGQAQYIAPKLGITSDFENVDEVINILDSTSILDNDPRLVTLLGQTLGNFDIEGRSNFVNKLYSSLSEGDMFLVGVELRPEDDDELFDSEIEKIKDNYKRDEDFARKGLSDEENAQRPGYFVEYDTDSHNVLMKFKSPNFEKTVSISHKFSVNELESLLTTPGFEIMGRSFYEGPRRRLNGSDVNSRKEYALYMVKK